MSELAAAMWSVSPAVVCVALLAAIRVCLVRLVGVPGRRELTLGLAGLCLPIILGYAMALTIYSQTDMILPNEDLLGIAFWMSLGGTIIAWALIVLGLHRVTGRLLGLMEQNRELARRIHTPRD